MPRKYLGICAPGWLLIGATAAGALAKAVWARLRKAGRIVRRS